MSIQRILTNFTKPQLFLPSSKFRNNNSLPKTQAGSTSPSKTKGVWRASKALQSAMNELKTPITRKWEGASATFNGNPKPNQNWNRTSIRGPGLLTSVLLGLFYFLDKNGGNAAKEMVQEASKQAWNQASASCPPRIPSFEIIQSDPPPTIPPSLSLPRDQESWRTSVWVEGKWVKNLKSLVKSPPKVSLLPPSNPAQLLVPIRRRRKCFSVPEMAQVEALQRSPKTSHGGF